MLFMLKLSYVIYVKIITVVYKVSLCNLCYTQPAETRDMQDPSTGLFLYTTIICLMAGVDVQRHVARPHLLRA